jgi:2-aminobenzoate-CoA ligase
VAISAGETLPAPVYEAWTKRTGVPILDGIGSTEKLHVLIANRLDDRRPGVTGTPVPGYEAKIVDKDFNEAPRGVVGLLAVRGPTGCRYLADVRQREYVRNGWDLTDDAFSQDEKDIFVSLRAATT